MRFINGQVELPENVDPLDFPEWLMEQEIDSDVLDNIDCLHPEMVEKVLPPTDPVRNPPTEHVLKNLHYPRSDYLHHTNRMLTLVESRILWSMIYRLCGREMSRRQQSPATVERAFRRMRLQMRALWRMYPTLRHRLPRPDSPILDAVERDRYYGEILRGARTALDGSVSREHYSPDALRWLNHLISTPDSCPVLSSEDDPLGMEDPDFFLSLIHI